MATSKSPSRCTSLGPHGKKDLCVCFFQRYTTLMAVLYIFAAESRKAAIVVCSSSLKILPDIFHKISRVKGEQLDSHTNRLSGWRPARLRKNWHNGSNDGNACPQQVARMSYTSWDSCHCLELIRNGMRVHIAAKFMVVPVVWTPWRSQSSSQDGRLPICFQVAKWSCRMWEDGLTMNLALKHEHSRCWLIKYWFGVRVPCPSQ